MRTVNTRFFLVLLGSTILFAAGLFGVHRLQAGNIANALLWQASQAEKNGKANLAARYLGQYLDFVPDDIDEREHLATVLADEKVAITPAARRRAEFVINQVLAWDPQRHQLRQALVRIALAGHRLDLAEEHLTYLQARLPASGAVAFLVGQWKEMQLQDRAGALKKTEQELLVKQMRQAYEKAIQAEPQKAEAYLRLVAVLRQQDFGKDEPKHAAEIERLVTAALKNAPDDAAVLSLAAQQAQARGDTARALKYLETGLKQNPTEPRLYLALARLHSQSGKRDEAIAQLNKGLAAVGKENHFELSWMLANLLLDADELDAARKLVTPMRDVNQLSADYLDARCLMCQGRWDAAARTLDKLRSPFKVVPELALQVDLFLGLCYQKGDDPLRALAAFQRAAKADPTSLLARHGEAVALAALGQRDEALKRFRDLIDGNTDRGKANRWRLQYARMLLAGNASADPQIGASCARYSTRRSATRARRSSVRCCGPRCCSPRKRPTRRRPNCTGSSGRTRAGSSRGSRWPSWRWSRSSRRRRSRYSRRPTAPWRIPSNTASRVWPSGPATARNAARSSTRSRRTAAGSPRRRRPGCSRRWRMRTTVGAD